MIRLAFRGHTIRVLQIVTTAISKSAWVGVHSRWRLLWLEPYPGRQMFSYREGNRHGIVETKLVDIEDLLT